MATVVERDVIVLDKAGAGFENAQQVVGILAMRHVGREGADPVDQRAPIKARPQLDAMQRDGARARRASACAASSAAVSSVEPSSTTMTQIPPGTCATRGHNSATGSILGNSAPEAISSSVSCSLPCQLRARREAQAQTVRPGGVLLEGAKDRAQRQAVAQVGQNVVIADRPKAMQKPGQNRARLAAAAGPRQQYPGPAKR